MRKVPRIKVNCLECGTEFETTQRRIDDGRGKFCNPSCTHRYLFTHKNPRKKDRIIRICDFCGNEFPVTPYYAVDHPGRPARRFCTQDCEHSFHTGERNPRYNSIELVCEICETHFFRRKGLIKRTPFRCCSDKCMGIWRKKTGIAAGENNPFYVHGTNDFHYNKGFKRDVRPDCLERYGLPPDSSYCVHHINYNKNDDHWLNLIPLPRNVHAWMNIEETRRAWFLFYSDLNILLYSIAFEEAGLLVFEDS